MGFNWLVVVSLGWLLWALARPSSGLTPLLSDEECSHSPVPGSSGVSTQMTVGVGAMDAGGGWGLQAAGISL